MDGIEINGTKFSEPIRLKEEVAGYFKKFFELEKWRRPSLICGSGRTLNESIHLWLERKVESKEIFEAIRHCDGGKVPGPDNFNFNFIKGAVAFFEE